MNMTLKSFREQLGDGERSKAPPPPIAPERLADPFSQLPAALELTPEQRTWLEADHYVPHSWFTLLAYQRAASIQGPTAANHEKRRRRFAEIQAEAERLGYRLPEDFVTLIETDEYVNRLRFGCHWIEMPEFLCPCPIDETCVMVLFLCEAQGCDYTQSPARKRMWNLATRPATRASCRKPSNTTRSR
ncbi:hypothetical protein BH23PLA1_BH23PLA1_20330 [soil metagenome]